MGEDRFKKTIHGYYLRFYIKYIFMIYPLPYINYGGIVNFCHLLIVSRDTSNLVLHTA